MLTSKKYRWRQLIVLPGFAVIHTCRGFIYAGSVCWRQSCKQQKINHFCIKKKFFSSLFMMHGWDSESVFLIYEIIYEKRRLFPFLDQNHESISLYSLNKAFFSISGPKAWKYFFIFMKQGWESESISLHLWNTVEKVKVFFYIYETRFRK